MVNSLIIVHVSIVFSSNLWGCSVREMEERKLRINTAADQWWRKVAANGCWLLRSSCNTETGYSTAGSAFRKWLSDNQVTVKLENMDWPYIV